MQYATEYSKLSRSLLLLVLLVLSIWLFIFLFFHHTFPFVDNKIIHLVCSSSSSSSSHLANDDNRIGYYLCYCFQTAYILCFSTIKFMSQIHSKTLLRTIVSNKQTKINNSYLSTICAQYLISRIYLKLFFIRVSPWI